MRKQSQTQAALLSQRSKQKEFITWALVVHTIGIIGGVVLFEPWAFGFAFFMASVTGYSMGIFHHMYLSHRSFRCHPVIENIGVLLGTLTWRGPMAAPVRYVAMHRIHHRYSDTDKDPHSPKEGWIHSLISWNWNHSDLFRRPELYNKLAPNWVRQNSFFKWLDQNVHTAQALYGLLLFSIGFAFFDLKTAVVLVIYGVFVKTLMLVYLANTVDLINHTIGYRNYETKDDSTNSFLMAAIHLGGAISWHNNHHARAAYFTVKGRWWEFDVHYLFLRFLSLFGLVSQIRILDDQEKVRVQKQKLEEQYASL